MTSIDALPDDVLLAVFNSYASQIETRWGKPREEIWEKAWRSLVHVCRRWRRIVFGSPHHLDLRLVCSERTRTRDTLDVWPALPLVIRTGGNYGTGNVDDIIASLERSDRVCKISFANHPRSDFEVFFAEMQKPFPELTELDLSSTGETAAVVPDSFLGGSAPHLRFLALGHFLYPGLPKLLLSATHLVTLYLMDIPHSGYISPGAMATTLAALTSLETLSFRFNSPESSPDLESRRLPPSKRSVLPVLTTFWFKGVTEYLEDLVACIDAPQLNSLGITFFSDIVFDTPQLVQFINRTPVSEALEKARIVFWEHEDDTEAKFSSQTESGYGKFEVKVLCRGPDRQISSLEQLCTSCLPPLSMLQDLYIYGFVEDWTDSIESTLWLGLLHPSTAVKNLYLSEDFASLIAPALKELVQGRMTVVLPALQNILLEELESSGPVREGIGQFVAARQSAGHSIAISPWIDAEQDMVPIFL